MSLFLEHRTLRGDNCYTLKPRTGMSAHKELQNETTEMHSVERLDEAITEFSPDMIEEKIKANLEPLQAQVITLTQMINKRIQDSSTSTNPEAGSLDRLLPYGCPITDRPGTSSTLPLTWLVTAGLSLDSNLWKTRRKIPDNESSRHATGFASRTVTAEWLLNNRKPSFLLDQTLMLCWTNRN